MSLHLFRPQPIKQPAWRFLARLSLGCVLAASAWAEAPMSGGATTKIIPRASLGDRSAFAFPAENLPLTRRDSFFVGNSFFRNAWITAPASTAARDGLGPLFNANACQSCHVRDGRGRLPEGREQMATALVRVSQPGQASVQAGVVPDPVYGDQIQNHSINDVPSEARVHIEWHEQEGEFADGSKYRLRRPEAVFEDLGYGKPEQPMLRSIRVAPVVIGIGLLDTIDTDALLANEDPDDADQDGISGRANRVWDRQLKKTVPGRFGWKAGQPTSLQQVAAAFAGDIGISSSLFPGQTCTPTQQGCGQSPNGGSPEVSDEILEFVNFYTKTLAVPARRAHDDPTILAGEALFNQAGCNSCHVDTWQTGEDEAFPELSGQEIHPYTDLLLHDMGEGLADHRPEFAASGSEWRTPPLWGIGLVSRVNQHTRFLHDGRARNLEEAVLWHGGEAQAAQTFYTALDKADRRRLIAFLRSL